MVLNDTDRENLLAILSYAVKHGVIESLEDAKVLLVLEAKLSAGEEKSPEEVDGDDIPASD